MKKLICILLSLILAMGILTGCDAGATNDPEETPKESGSQTSAETPKESDTAAQTPAESDSVKNEAAFVHPYPLIRVVDDEMKEIEEAWLDVENNGLKEFKESIFVNHIKHVIGKPFEWYGPNAVDFESARYYGYAGDYQLIYVYLGRNQLSSAVSFTQIADHSIASCMLFVIFAYKDGKFETLDQAYKDGKISNNDIETMIVLHYKYERHILTDIYGSDQESIFPENWVFSDQ
jgi:hypothetical protein